MTEKELLPFCECGKCGLRVTKKGNKYIHGHNRRGVSLPHTPEACASMSVSHTDVPLSLEHCDAISVGQTGIPHSPEWNAAISEARLNSDAAQELYDMMRGGNDICKHHYIYDHADLSLNTIQMARSDHAKLHALLKKLGYIIPHVNVPGKQGKDAREYVLQPKGL